MKWRWENKRRETELENKTREHETEYWKIKDRQLLSYKIKDVKLNWKVKDVGPNFWKTKDVKRRWKNKIRETELENKRCEADLEKNRNCKYARKYSN